MDSQHKTKSFEILKEHRVIVRKNERMLPPPPKECCLKMARISLNWTIAKLGRDYQVIITICTRVSAIMTYLVSDKVLKLLPLHYNIMAISAFRFTRECWKNPFKGEAADGWKQKLPLHSTEEKSWRIIKLRRCNNDVVVATYFSKGLYFNGAHKNNGH